MGPAAEFGAGCGASGFVVREVRGQTHTPIKTSYQNLFDWMEQHDAKITRIDLAHDDFEGNRTVYDALEWYQKGQFKGK